MIRLFIEGYLLLATVSQSRSWAHAINWAEQDDGNHRFENDLLDMEEIMRVQTIITCDESSASTSLKICLFLHQDCASFDLVCGSVTSQHARPPRSRRISHLLLAATFNPISPANCSMLNIHQLLVPSDEQSHVHSTFDAGQSCAQDRVCINAPNRTLSQGRISLFLLSRRLLSHTLETPFAASVDLVVRMCKWPPWNVVEWASSVIGCADLLIRSSSRCALRIDD